MTHTWEELKHKTVAQLREIAADIDHEAVKGYTQLNKEHLLAAICRALNIERHAHHHVEGVNKSMLKSQIHDLKKKRDEALAAHDHKQLKEVRREIHHIKRQLHRATV
jgi:flagellar biosynthesis/type III secretory pathway protein FliH